MQSGVTPNKWHPWVAQQDESGSYRFGIRTPDENKDFLAMDGTTPFFIVGAFIMFVFVVIFCLVCQAVLKWIRYGGNNNLMWGSFQARRAAAMQAEPVCYPPPENVRQLPPENPLIQQISPQRYEPVPQFSPNHPMQPTQQMQPFVSPNQLMQPILTQGDRSPQSLLQGQQMHQQQQPMQQFQQPATAPQFSEVEDLPPKYERLFPKH